ncbi:hypothetical protein BN2476_530056 [Paraburkholderia piptadeniae]|uniref:Uncharacterized protein n=1 Tax=Paraburkholderia piptadeniae TaxID=1701573 RepID=A0A1N7SHN1_9BURK|nr:hypothetical protein BN2476_530056 [Paraburkholderia piptadeniae]
MRAVPKMGYTPLQLPQVAMSPSQHSASPSSYCDDVPLITRPPVVVLSPALTSRSIRSPLCCFFDVKRQIFGTARAYPLRAPHRIGHAANASPRCCPDRVADIGKRSTGLPVPNHKLLAKLQGIAEGIKPDRCQFTALNSAQSQYCDAISFGYGLQLQRHSSPSRTVCLPIIVSGR